MEPSSYKWIVGSGPLLAAAAAAWGERMPHASIGTIEVSQDAGFAFDLGALDRINSLGPDAGASAFVAIGSQFMNFRRFELMALLKERGFKLPALVCRGALVAADVSLPENSWVGAGAILGAGSRIGYNTFIGAGVIAGEACVLGNSVWLEAGVQLGRGSKVGANTIIGRGVILEDGIEVGKGSVVDIPGRYAREVPARTFLNPDFDEPVVVVGA